MNFPPENPQNPFAATRAPLTNNPAHVAESKKHSGMGIASFAISILVGLGTVVLVVAAATLATTIQPGQEPEPTALLMGVGFGLFAIVGLSLIGIGLGIGGLIQANRTRVFAILGLAFNGLVVLGLLGLFLIGLAAG